MRTDTDEIDLDFDMEQQKGCSHSQDDFTTLHCMVTITCCDCLHSMNGLRWGRLTEQARCNLTGDLTFTCPSYSLHENAMFFVFCSVPVCQVNIFYSIMFKLDVCLRTCVWHSHVTHSVWCHCMNQMEHEDIWNYFKESIWQCLHPK